MQKRRIIIGDYDTAAHGWTLSGWNLSAAEQKTKFEDKPNGDGAWDLSTSLTDGIPRYSDRKLVATFECSEGTRMEREAVIRNMINSLDGLRVKIKLPDDDHHHVVGRVHVAREYNDLAHAAVSLTAVCEPWKYADTETIVVLKASAEKKPLDLRNNGRRAVVPTLTVEGAGASVLLEYGTSSLALGVCRARSWPTLLLTTGSHRVLCSGTGTLTVTYREAVLE